VLAVGGWWCMERIFQMPTLCTTQGERERKLLVQFFLICRLSECVRLLTDEHTRLCHISPAKSCFYGIVSLAWKNDSSGLRPL
jgi:hypothetical protein